MGAGEEVVGKARRDEETSIKQARLFRAKLKLRGAFVAAQTFRMVKMLRR